MSHQRERISVTPRLLILAIVTAACGVLYLYLEGVDTVGVWVAVSDVVLQILILFPVFCGIGAAFSLSVRGFGARSVRLLFLVLLGCFTYQSLVTMLDYLLFLDYELWAAVLFGLLGGVVSGILYNGLLLVLLFGAPYLLFLRNKKHSSVPYAAAACSVGYLLFRIVQRTVDVLLFLSEHLWIANRSEIVSFVIYYLYDFVLAAVAYGFVRFGIRLINQGCIRF